MFKHGIEYWRPRCESKHESSVWSESCVCKVQPNPSCASLSFDWTFSIVLHCGLSFLDRQKSGDPERLSVTELTCQDGFVRFELLSSYKQTAVSEPGAFPQIAQIIWQLALGNFQHVCVRLARDVHRVLNHTHLNKQVSKDVSEALWGYVYTSPLSFDHSIRKWKRFWDFHRVSEKISIQTTQLKSYK